SRRRHTSSKRDWSSDVCSSDLWLSPVEFQNAFTRAHAFAAGADSTMAKYVCVGPRLSLTGLSADEWIATRAGAEGLLAFSMAQEIGRASWRERGERWERAGAG